MCIRREAFPWVTVDYFGLIQHKPLSFHWQRNRHLLWFQLLILTARWNSLTKYHVANISFLRALSKPPTGGSLPIPALWGLELTWWVCSWGFYRGPAIRFQSPPVTPPSSGTWSLSLPRGRESIMKKANRVHHEDNAWPGTVGMARVVSVLPHVAGMRPLQGLSVMHCGAGPRAQCQPRAPVREVASWSCKEQTSSL